MLTKYVFQPTSKLSPPGFDQMFVSAYLQVNSPASISLPIRLCKFINSFLTFLWAHEKNSSYLCKSISHSLTCAGLLLLLVKTVTLLWTEVFLLKKNQNWTKNWKYQRWWLYYVSGLHQRHKLKTNVSIWCLYTPCARVHVVKCVQRGFCTEEKVTTSRA